MASKPPIDLPKGVQTNGLPQGVNDLLAAALGNAILTPQDLPASMVVTGDEIEFHAGHKIGLPKDMSFRKARDVLTRVEKDQQTVVGQTKTFKYRPYDGAVACARVMKRRYGITFGEKIRTFFGETPPQTLSVPISVTESVEVPWGLVSIPSLGGSELNLHSSRDREYGMVFAIQAEYPKKWTNEIKEFLQEVEKELKENSIYRGQAIVGTEQPEFLDMSGFRSSEIVFSDNVEEVLEGTVWSVLRYTDQLKAEGVKIKRAALLEGPYGCGKTSAGQLTAEVAVANGWTYIKSKVGEDINEVMKLARLYAPAVAFIEDVDNAASTGEDGEVTKLLDTFDGITAKGQELMVLMTTNHLNRIHKGMLRPGRLDAVIHVAELDKGGVERLIKAVVGKERLADDIDYAAVYDAMKVQLDSNPGEAPRYHGFFPAFVREALERAKTVAIGRNQGKADYVLDTEALRVAAISLQPQLKIMLEAEEGERKPVLDGLFSELVRRNVDGTEVHRGGEPWAQVVAPELAERNGR